MSPPSAPVAEDTRQKGSLGQLSDSVTSSTSLGLVFISHPQFGRLQATGATSDNPSLEQPFDGILARGGVCQYLPAIFFDFFFNFAPRTHRSSRKDWRKTGGVGKEEGAKVGRCEGGKVGRWEGAKVGRWEGAKVGRCEGGKVRRWEGAKVERWEGVVGGDRRSAVRFLVAWGLALR